jgi:hypothetical protein
LGFDILHRALSVASVMFFLGALIFWAVGLLSDQISKIAISARMK